MFGSDNPASSNDVWVFSNRPSSCSNSRIRASGFPESYRGRLQGIKKQLKPDISDHAELIIARIAAGGAVILAGHFGRLFTDDLLMAFNAFQHNI